MSKMSKKTTVKKPRRRLKRTARRSIAAILMITAIGVAAVPVPENWADNGDATTDDPNALAVPYAYDGSKYSANKFGSVSLKMPTVAGKITIEEPVLDADGKEQYDADGNLITTKKQIDGMVEDPKKVFRTHYIFVDGGSYRMEWQYKFFLQTVNGEDKGIICGYNDTYNTELLKVATDPIYDYYTVLDYDHGYDKDGKKLTGVDDIETSNDTYEEFKAKAKGEKKDSSGNYYPSYQKFTCQAHPDAASSPSDADFQRYFPVEYDAQLSKWNNYDADKAAYEEKLAKWEAEHPGYSADEKQAFDDENKPAVPKAIEKTPADFSLEDDEYIWRLYYCDMHSSLKGYILTKVADSERTTKLGSATTVFSYVPQRINLADKTEQDDEFGFRIANWTSFIGIGDEAFGTSDPAGMGVQNVTNIELPDAIKYVGDYAFAGSFIGSIRMVNVANVGNYAFKQCPKLSEVEFVEGVTNIGKEAFYGVQNLKTIEFPDTIRYIGPAAFAACSQLSDVDFSKLSLNLTVDDYAFYNDVALNNVNFIKAGTEDTTVSIVGLGKGAFAINSSVKGNLTDFVIPQGISANEDATLGSNGGLGVGGVGLGDFLLAGRTNLLHVTMSENYGSTSTIKLPSDLFYNCINLEWVKFPDTGNSCGFAQFDKDLFDTVSNPNFFVQGPKYLSPSNKVPAEPRKATWEAESAVSKTIPYVYYENGVRYVEVSDGIYLECIDQNGVLISCTLNPKYTANSPEVKDGIDLIIPAEVAGVTVTGIASNCFTDDVLNQAVRTLTIIDGSKLETINDSVFAGWENLQKAYIGDSVRTVGNNVFLGDKKLIDITFNTPESAAGEFTVGTDAFKTNGLELTFHGLINGQYAPYRWAVDKDNVIDTDKGIRVCYKSLAPTNLTVMYDGASGQVTLLDYPKYADVEEILGESYATKKGVNWKNWVKLDGFKAKSASEFYKDWMEREYYNLYASDQYDVKREAFKTAWDSAQDASEVYNNFDVYGPWVTPAYCESFGAAPAPNPNPDDTTKVTFDWLFEPITAYAASGTPEPYFKKHPYDVFENYERSSAEAYGQYQTQTQDELAVINATRNITVPDGVTSIDVNAYLTAEENSGNAATYFTSEKLGYETARMYRIKPEGSSSDASDRDNSVIPGLFSGVYEDYKVGADGSSNPKESIAKGNDRLESVNLNGVTYLPQYAFDNCENLQKVTIGKAMADIGTLPFRGCTSLTNVVIADDNTKYFVERDEDDLCKRIIYSRSREATEDSPLFTIEECLETRGMNNDNGVVDSAYDTLITFVNAIADGAFAHCSNVEDVNLTDAAHLTVIPKKCFMDCEDLTEVRLPMSVNKIEEYAFYNADKLGTLRIPGREVSFTDYVFEDNSKSRTDIVTYEDSAARRYADTNKEKYNLRWVDIGELWEVRFYDMDGTQIGDTLQVDDNTRLKREQIPADPVKEGYTFDTWVGTGGITVDDYITQPTNFIAKYNSRGGMVDGKYVVEFRDGITGRLLAGDEASSDDKYYIEAGTSFDSQEPAWTAPKYKDHEDEGYKFLKWSDNWTESTVISSNMTIIALYEATNAGNPGNNTGTSGGTTNTSGGGTTTSSRNTSNTSNTSSSNSTSTTTTSSSSNSTVGKFTVTVVNGNGSGSYDVGSTVVISANTPAAGMVFSKWTTESNGVTLASVSLPATTFTMPANNVTVTANYVAAGTAPTGSNGGGGNGGGGTTNNRGNTEIDITKPGISNKDLATANVNGSTDNFIVKITETDEATQAVAAALTNKYGSLDNILYYAMDISLYDSTGTTKITDVSGLSIDIMIPIPDALVAYGGNNMAGAVINGDQLENLNESFTTVNGVPMIRFTATHFSPYTIYVDTGNLTEGMLDVTPKTGDPIHPKWFLSIGLACLSIILFIKKDKKVKVKTA